MKILLVHNYYQQRGGEDVVFERERDLLRRNGNEVAEYCRSNDVLRELNVLNKLVAVKGIVWASDAHRELLAQLRREKYDVVHVHNTFLQISPSIYWACHKADVPVVQTLHNYRLFCPSANFIREAKVCRECVQDGIWRGIQHGCYRSSRPATAGVALMLLTHRYCGTWTTCVDRFIALSTFARDQYVAAGLAIDRIVVKPNFVDGDPGCRNGIGDYALYVGRLSEEKGVATLLAAIQKLDGSIPLRIVGDGPLRSDLEARVASAGLSHVVEFTKWLPKQEVVSAIKGARFLVSPSECYETFGMVIAEAYACGVPVIGSALGAIGEIIEDGKTGLWFKTGDPDNLAAMIRWAWDHPERMKGMGQQARIKYETKYSETRNYELLMNVYREAINARANISQARGA